MHLATLTVAFIALTVQAGEALRCWRCSSDSNENCGDPFVNERHSFISDDCDRDRSQSFYSARYAACRKVVTMLDGQKRVNRACSWVHNKDEDHCSKTNVHIPSRAELVSCDYCDSDECNSATSVSASLALGLAVIAAKLLA